MIIGIKYHGIPNIDSTKKNTDIIRIAFIALNGKTNPSTTAFLNVLFFSFGSQFV